MGGDQEHLSFPFCDGCGLTFMYWNPRADERAAQKPIIIAIHGSWTAVMATLMATPPDRAELWIWTCKTWYSSWCVHYLKNWILTKSTWNGSSQPIILSWCVRFQSIMLWLFSTLWGNLLRGNVLTTVAHHVHLSFGAGEHRNRHRHDNTDGQRQIRPIYHSEFQFFLPPLRHQCRVKTGPEHPQKQCSCEKERKGGSSHAWFN